MSRSKLLPLFARRSASLAASLFLIAVMPACADEGHGDEHDDHEHGHEDETEGHDDHGHETEVISTIELTFTPTGGGDPVVAQFVDPDGDGGQSGMSDEIVLAPSTEYTLDLRFVNALETPEEDITEEIREEAEEHFVLIYGDAVEGPATTLTGGVVVHAYADLESDYGPNAVGEDLPVGLSNTITTGASGDGKIQVMLRHLPPLNDVPQKTADLVSDFAAGMPIAGEVDVDVSFDLSLE